MIMKKYKLTLWLFCLSLITFILYQLASHFPYFVEVYYSRGINHYMLQILSHMTGWFPFSLLEIGSYALIIYLLLHILYRFIKVVQAPSTWKRQLMIWFIHTFNLLCILWLSFAYGWGFNYSRQPLNTSLELKTSETPHEDLKSLYAYLIEQANAIRPYLTEDSFGYMMISEDFTSIMQRTSKGYEALSKTYPLFDGSYAKPKGLLISPFMNYTGITGIYSPFTGEANVNTAILPQSIPVTALHEMAHQRGFAKEAECNFIAFLACQAHPDLDFQYSGYLLAIAYTSQTLAQVDYEALISLNQTLSEKVMNDINHNNAFWQHYAGPVEKASSSLNNRYLKANGIKEGTDNYGEMVTLLLNYYITHLKP